MRAVSVDLVDNGPRPGWCPVGRRRPRDAGTRPGHHGRHREPHRRRRRQPGWRDRVAHAQARARRQSRGGRGGHRGRRHRAGVGQRPPRPVLGAARRWRELRRRQLVPVRAAPRRPHRHGGPVFWAAEDTIDVLRFYRDFVADAPERWTVIRLGDAAAAGGRPGPALPARRGCQLLRRTRRRR